MIISEGIFILKNEPNHVSLDDGTKLEIPSDITLPLLHKYISLDSKKYIRSSLLYFTI